MKMQRLIWAVVTASACLLPLNAYAADAGGCETFAWPIATELQWLKAADSEAVASGGTVKQLPTKAIALALLPMNEVKFTAEESRRRKEADATQFGGSVNFESVGEPGIYQISLPVRSWVDVVQGGKTLKSAAHSSKTDCDGVRKSIRYAIGQGPVTVEVSGLPSDTVKFVVRRAD